MTNIDIRITDLGGDENFITIDGSSTLSDLYANVVKTIGMVSDENDSNNYDFQLIENEPFDSQGKTGIRNFSYILHSKKNVDCDFNMLSDLCGPIALSSYIGINDLPTYRSILEATRRQEHDYLLKRNTILCSLIFIFLSMGSLAAINPLSGRIQHANYKIQEAKQDISEFSSEDKCNISFFDIDFAKYDGQTRSMPNIGTQKDFDDWSECIKQAKSISQEDICNHTQFFYNHGHCATNDLQKFC